MSTPAVRPDPFVLAHQDARKAVATFLPSLVGRQDEQPPTPPNPMAAPLQGLQEAMRTASLARHVEKMSARVARGLPPEEEQQTPEKSFGNVLDAVHTRAIQEAIASHPEEQRGQLISEAHDSLVKLIASHNGKLIVHGKVEIASTPESAERLAAKIVNNEVEGHDQRRAAESAAAAEDNGDGVPPSDRVPVPAGTGAVDSRTQAAQPNVPSGGNNDIRNPANVQGVPPVNPEVVPPGDGQPPAQGPPPVVKPQEAAKVGLRKPDGHQITQPKNSVPANQKLAGAAAPELTQALSTIAQQVPGVKFDRIRPQKSTDRLDQKLSDDNDPDTLSDYLGAQVSADTPQAKDLMIAALKKSFKVIEVDDQFLTGRKDKAQYPSANVQVQLSNGSTAEVQIVPAEVQAATEQSHEFYKAGREAEEKGDTAERDKQWAKAGEINQNQLAQFKARNGIHDQSQSVNGYDVIGEPIKVGSHTFLRVKQGGQNVTQAAPAPAAPVVSGDQASGQDKGAPADASISEPAQASMEEDRTPKFSKGQSVTLKDGTSAQVAYVHPEKANVMRVRTSDGRNLNINPLEDLHAAAE